MANPILFFSIDGMRPDGLLQADTPFFKQMIASGSSTLSAQTVMPSVTLPCHTSMHRGVDVPRHGITTNTFQPLARPVPSLFDVAKLANLTTGIFFNWGELRDLMAPDSPTVSYLYNDSTTPDTDRIVARAAVEQVKTKPLDIVFVYLGHTDNAGHDHGWMSQPYIDAISNADKCAALVYEAYLAQSLHPTVLILSDHGGHERSHGTDLPEDMTIPWILNGVGIKEGFQITETVRIYDTCPTLAALAGLTAAKQWDGQVVTEAFR